MRIVIDLQGAQTSGSRGRGIGRYSLSLALAMIKNRGDHEIFIVISDSYPKTIDPIRELFKDFLPAENLFVWHSIDNVDYLNPNNSWRRQAAELAFESFLVSLAPDIILVSSMFEGLGDNAITTVNGLEKTALTAVILYDLIPLINKEIYLSNPPVAAWYGDKIQKLKRSDILLSISESSRLEGINYLGFSSENVVNISTAADSHFTIKNITQEVASDVRNRYGLTKPFVMYTGGIDHRKNIEGLIRAFALLPKKLRLEHQLAVVCSINEEWRTILGELTKKTGLAAEDVIFTGYIPEDDLVVLYHICQVFVFPSWHEGFGLPALEAMSCGAPVIGANTSSLPEVIGRDDALFDPRDDLAISKKIEHVLTDDLYRAALIAHGHEQSKKFAWEKIGLSAIQAFENLLQVKSAKKSVPVAEKKRLKLAYISPLPPERSGISDYSAELLPALCEHYEIDVIVAQKTVSDDWVNGHCTVRDVDWFLAHSQEYERVLFHFGNSHFHMHMFNLLSQVPGVVVLHDFFLSGAVYSEEAYGLRVHAWSEAIYHSHGYPALTDRFSNDDVNYGMTAYPCNREVLETSRSIIVHSNYSRVLAEKWYGAGYAKEWSTIPLLRVSAPPVNKVDAKRALGLSEDVFLVCSFGFMHPTKLNHRLLTAWINSSLSKNQKCQLVFVGQNHEGDYGRNLLAAIEKSGYKNRINITGWTDNKRYYQYLDAADVGVQLRTTSRGETSAAVLDCMNYGLATIVNANGSMAELPKDAVWMLADEFDDKELVEALENVLEDSKLKNQLSAYGKSHVHQQHAPAKCASLYAEAIERAYANEDNLLAKISALESPPTDSEEWLKIADIIARNSHNSFARQILVDVTSIMGGDPANSGYYPGVKGLADFIINPPEGFRVEPVYANTACGGYMYAKKFSLRLLGCPEDVLDDSQVVISSGDIYFGVAPMPKAVAKSDVYFKHLKAHGVKVYFFISDALEIFNIDNEDLYSENLYEWLNEVGCADGLVTTTDVLEKLTVLLDVFCPSREQPLPVSSIILKERQPRLENGSKWTVTRDIIETVLNNQWNTHWKSDGVIRIWGADKRLHTQNGIRSGQSILSSKKPGFLVYGPYIPLSSGNYVVRIKGSINSGKIGGAHIDAAVNGGQLILGASTEWILAENDYIISLPVSLMKSCQDLEVRVWVDSESEFKISMLEISRV